MHRLQALRRIILPQAMRVILPPIGNEFIGLVKWTSLASVIQFSELMYASESIYYVNNRVIEMLFVAAFWYLVVRCSLSCKHASSGTSPVGPGVLLSRANRDKKNGSDP